MLIDCHFFREMIKKLYLTKYYIKKKACLFFLFNSKAFFVFCKNAKSLVIQCLIPLWNFYAKIVICSIRSFPRKKNWATFYIKFIFYSTMFEQNLKIILAFRSITATRNSYTAITIFSSKTKQNKKLFPSINFFQSSFFLIEKGFFWFKTTLHSN